MSFSFRPFDEIPDVLLIEPKAFGDDRGWFAMTYRQSVFERAGLPSEFPQDNHSRSTQGVLRGLHYQKEPRAQGKLVRCVAGEIFDVAVDIRKGSPTYGKWVGERLTAASRKILWVPPGFAHGFVALSDVAEVLYKTTAEYAPELERG